MDVSVMDAGLVATPARLMPIGMGPKVAMVPVLEKTCALRHRPRCFELARCPA